MLREMMKKSSLLLACLLSGAASFDVAQDMYQKSGAMAHPSMAKKKPTKMSLKGVMMKDGKMMKMMSDGQIKPMDKNMMMGGMKVAPDGTMTMKGGSSVMMKNGDSMMMDGAMGV